MTHPFERSFRYANTTLSLSNFKHWQQQAQQALLLDFDSSELAALVPSQISQSNHHAPVKPPSQIVDELIEEVSSFAAVPTGTSNPSRHTLSTHLVNSFYQHFSNTLYQHPLNTLYQHLLNTL